MPDEATATTDATEDVQAATTDAAPADDNLGDPGKKALQAEREARKTAERELKDLRSRIQAMEEAQNKTAEERAALEQQRELERAALSKANERILAAEIRAAAKGELADPSDALTFIDRSTFEVGDDGSVDGDAIKSAISELLEQKPYLAARREPKVEGSADGGTREASRPRQLNRADMARMTPEQISEAMSKGQFAELLGGKA